MATRLCFAIPSNCNVNRKTLQGDFVRKVDRPGILLQMSKICGFETYKVDSDLLSIRDTQTPRGVPSETSRVVVC